MLNVTYNRLTDPDVKVTSASAHLPLFGRWCKLNVTSYSVGGGTAITFGLEKSKTSEIRHNQSDASSNGAVVLARGMGGNRQTFEQDIVAPKLVGQLLDWSTLEGGGTQAGRTVSDAIMRRTESIVETVRQSIRRNLGENAKDQTLRMLNHRYGKATYETIRSFLGEINWRLMLEGAGLTDDAATVIDYELAHHPIRVYRITHGDTDIPLLANAALNRFDRTTLANIKATTLLKKVCGEKLGEQFEKTGKIIIRQYDYRFVIIPGQFVECVDPNGKTARLCIHTIGFSCNPIDEVIISYLHIRNKFDEWMRMATVHGAEQGFQRSRKQLA